MEFSLATIVILTVIFISLCSTTRQCETQINTHSLNAHGAPGALAARGREGTAVHGEIMALIYFSHFVSTFAFCNCSAHLHNLLVELINWQRIVELPSMCGEQIIAVIVTIAFICWVSSSSVCLGGPRGDSRGQWLRAPGLSHIAHLDPDFVAY